MKYMSYIIWPEKISESLESSKVLVIQIPKKVSTLLNMRCICQHSWWLTVYVVKYFIKFFLNFVLKFYNKPFPAPQAPRWFATMARARMFFKNKLITSKFKNEGQIKKKVHLLRDNAPIVREKKLTHYMEVSHGYVKHQPCRVKFAHDRPSSAIVSYW